MSVFRWGNPDAFQLLWLVVVIFALNFWLSKQTTKKWPSFLKANKQSIFLKRLRFLLQLASLTLFIFALARPQSGQSTQKIKSEGVEMVLVVDVSNSMLAEDVKPSRLEMTKKELERFVQNLSGDRVGLVAFAGSAVTLSPLTPDRGALQMFINSLSPEAVSTQGTAFRKALDEAENLLLRGGTEEDNTSKATKVVVLISDGEDQEEGAIRKAEELAKKGVVIYTITVGTEKGAPVPMRDDRGQLAGYKKDEKGQVVLSRSVGESLQKLASIGHGKSYHMVLGGNTMKTLRTDIDALQKAQFESMDFVQYEERFQLFVLMGLILGLLSLVFSDRMFWEKTSVILVGGFLLATPSANATSLEAWFNNRAGVNALKENQSSLAYQKFLETLKSESLSPEVHLNLGLYFESVENYDEALKAYEVAEQLAKTSEEKFYSLFNQGSVAAKKQDIDRALKAYQGALDIYPESAEVKKNIELLWQQSQGKGKGKNKDDKNQDKNNQDQNKDQQGKGDKDQKDQKDPKDNKDQKDKKDQPKPNNQQFKSQQLSQEDVKKILEELKNQEQAIRAKEYERGKKENPKGKDW